MSRIARAPSISVKWTVRYSVATIVVISCVSWFHYFQVVEKIERDMRLLLHLQANGILARLKAAPHDMSALESYLDENPAMEFRVLHLGFRVLDRYGFVRFERGSLMKQPVPVPTLEQLPKTSSEVLITEADVGKAYPFFCIAIVAPDGGWIQVAVYKQLFARSAREIRNVFLLSIPVIALLTTIFGWVLAWGSLRPISQITKSAQRITAARLEQRIPRTKTGDELDRLAETLNEMFDRIAQGVSRMRRFTGDAAHELRAPIARLRNRLEAALKNPGQAPADREVLEQTLNDVDRLSDTIGAMLRLAQSEAGLDPDCVETVELFGLVEEVVEFFRPLSQDAGVALNLSASPRVRVVGDPGWLHQLFANLIENALKFTPDGGRVDVTVDAIGDQARVRVSDSGLGVALDEQERIFEPFHRAAVPVSKTGAGLGLALAREMARAHGGEISVSSDPGEGATFSVLLPTSASLS